MWRHQQYVVLHNANRDTVLPVTLSSLRAQLVNQERHTSFGQGNILQVGGKAGGDRWAELAEHAQESLRHQREIHNQNNQAEDLSGEVLKISPRTPLMSDEWQSVYSEVTNQMFYYNSKTQVGTFEKPSEWPD